LIGRKYDERENDCEEKAAFHQLRDRIQTRATKGVATKYTLEAQPSAPERAVSDNRFGRILRAGRQIPT
jgi:hypothetical protein